MTKVDDERANCNDYTAAEWFVALDADGAASGGFANSQDAVDPVEQVESWLAESSEHEDALARCEAAVHVAKVLKADTDLRWAYDEAARIAAAPPPVRESARAVRCFGRPEVAWSVAALSSLVAVILFIDRVSPSPPVAVTAEIIEAAAPDDRRAASDAVATDTPDGAAAERMPSSDAALVRPISNPSVVLPGQIVVDARSLAVMPFDVVVETEIPSPEDERAARAIAAELYDSMVQRLAAIPGVYVVDRHSVVPYAGTDLQPSELAAQLGVRAVVEGRVASDDGRVRIVLRLIDAAIPGREAWQSTFERRVDASSGIDAAMAVDMVSALASATGPTRNPATY